MSEAGRELGEARSALAMAEAEARGLEGEVEQLRVLSGGGTGYNPGLDELHALHEENRGLERRLAGLPYIEAQLADARRAKADLEAQLARQGREHAEALTRSRLAALGLAADDDEGIAPAAGRAAPAAAHARPSQLTPGLSPARSDRDRLRVTSFDSPLGARGRSAAARGDAGPRVWEVDTQDGSILQDLQAAEDGDNRCGYQSDLLGTGQAGLALISPDTDNKLFLACDSIDGDQDNRSVDLIDGGGLSGPAAERAVAALEAHAARQAAEQEQRAAAAALAEGETWTLDF